MKNLLLKALYQPLSYIRLRPLMCQTSLQLRRYSTTSKCKNYVNSLQTL